VNDVAQSVLNALKLEESCGQIYEIGGPSVYTQLELYEIMMNQLNRNVSLKYFDNKIAKKVAEHILNWRYFNLDDLIKDDLNLVVSPDAKNINDLFINPISFPIASEQYLAPAAVRAPKTHEYDES
jgi:NADH dehydrogenase (ubiquinone) 1 alpha subcomplex subunit 9